MIVCVSENNMKINIFILLSIGFLEFACSNNQTYVSEILRTPQQIDSGAVVVPLHYFSLKNENINKICIVMEDSLINLKKVPGEDARNFAAAHSDLKIYVYQDKGEIIEFSDPLISWKRYGFLSGETEFSLCPHTKIGENKINPNAKVTKIMINTPKQINSKGIFFVSEPRPSSY